MLPGLLHGPVHLHRSPSWLPLGRRPGWRLNMLPGQIVRGRRKTGRDPKELGNLSNLMWLGLAGNSNRFTGEIPQRLGRHLGWMPLSGILSGNALVFVRDVGNCRRRGGVRSGGSCQHVAAWRVEFGMARLISAEHAPEPEHAGRHVRLPGTCRPSTTVY